MVEVTLLTRKPSSQKWIQLHLFSGVLALGMRLHPTGEAHVEPG